MSSLFTDGGTCVRGDETVGGAWLPALRERRFIVAYGPVITSEIHLAHCGASRHSNNTAELTTAVEALWFLRSPGYVPAEANTYVFLKLKAAAALDAYGYISDMNTPWRCLAVGPRISVAPQQLNFSTQFVNVSNISVNVSTTTVATMLNVVDSLASELTFFFLRHLLRILGPLLCFSFQRSRLPTFPRIL